MPLHKFNHFTGMKPDVNDKRLPENFALQAINAYTDDGTINVYRTLAQVCTLAQTGTIRSLYKMSEHTAAGSFSWTDPNGIVIVGTWLAWTSAQAPNGVNVVRTPIANNIGERVIFTGTDVPRYTDYATSTSGGGTGPYPFASLNLKIPAPANILYVSVGQNTPIGIQLQWSIAGTVNDAINNRIARTYTYTYVTADGVEGPPASPSDIAYSNVDEIVTLTNFPGIPSGAYNITKMRIYRSIGNKSYLQVAEVPITTTTYADSILDSALTIQLPSTLWSNPPDGLIGIVSMANGMIAGYVGNDLYFSEPYQVQAWPEDYIKHLDYPITGLASAQNMLLISTEGYPYIAMGTTPGVIQLMNLSIAEANLSLRSMVSMGVGTVYPGAMYAGADGLWLIQNGQTTMITEAVISRRVWRMLNPAKIHAYYWRNKYFGFYDTGLTGNITTETGEIFPAKGGFLFDPVALSLTFVDVYCDAAYSDKTSGYLFLVQNISGTNTVFAWDGGTTNKSMYWKTKTELTTYCNMAKAKIEAKRYPVTLIVSGDGVSNTYTVNDSNIFPLKSGYMAREWSYSFAGDTILQAAYIATSTAEITNGQ